MIVTVGELNPESPDAPVAAHYGDPLREQRLSPALVDRSHRGTLTLTGPERLSFLHNLTTQHLLALAPGQATQALILSPHGHVEHHFWVTAIDGALILDTEPGYAGPLEQFLLKMRFFTQVELEKSDLRVYSVYLASSSAGSSLAGSSPAKAGSGLADAPDVLPVPGAKFATGAVPARPTSIYAVTALPGGGYARRTELGFDLLLPEGADPDQAASHVLAGSPSSAGAASGDMASGGAGLGDLVSGGLVSGSGVSGGGVSEAGSIGRAGIWAYEAHRVAAGVPRLGFDTDHKTLPSEARLTAVAVHLEKGCYRGQETIARVHHLGRPPRELRLLHFDGVSANHLPEPGTPVTNGERTVGFVGTAVEHFEQGPIALGIIRRNISGENPLLAGESTVAVESFHD
jgi:folate-binding protein YgfZ